MCIKIKDSCYVGFEMTGVLSFKKILIGLNLHKNIIVHIKVLKKLFSRPLTKWENNHLCSVYSKRNLKCLDYISKSNKLFQK